MREVEGEGGEAGGRTVVKGHHVTIHMVVQTWYSCEEILREVAQH